MRVAVAVSGGVDSAVAALLLKRQGHCVLGVHMTNWDGCEEGGGCTAMDDLHSARRVCQHLGIEFKHVTLVKEYWNHVFSQLLRAYEKGLTPNPDILCNAHVKFGAFHSTVQRLFPVEAIATGHYARLSAASGGRAARRLVKAVDTAKDQTYFLSHVPQAALQRTIFPVGHLKKRQVRELASGAGLGWLAQRRESMGISQYLEERPGAFVSLEGAVLGTHAGHHLYTIGQRARLAGRAGAWFVCAKDVPSNTVTVVEGTQHAALYSQHFTTEQPHWLCREHSEGTCQLRVRHQQPLMSCKLRPAGNGGLHVHTEQPLRAVTPGQCAVFYSREECLGGAFIESSSAAQATLMT